MRILPIEWETSRSYLRGKKREDQKSLSERYQSTLLATDYSCHLGLCGFERFQLRVLPDLWVFVIAIVHLRKWPLELSRLARLKWSEASFLSLLWSSWWACNLWVSLDLYLRWLVLEVQRLESEVGAVGLEVRTGRKKRTTGLMEALPRICEWSQQQMIDS